MSVIGSPRVGMVGGGQLARMTAPAATALAVDFRVLATTHDESAAQVCADVAIGRHDDLEALIAFSDGCDVVTFDHEHVPPAYLHDLEARGVAVRPGPEALVHAQDKVLMRQALTAAGVPCPRWQVVADLESGAAFGDEVGWPIIVKTSRGGYDGKGVWVVASAEELADLLDTVPLAPQAQWLAEERVRFTRELAAQVARSPHGQAVAYPVVQTTQIDGICAEVVAPAPGLSDELASRAQEVALLIAERLGVVGMLAVELFEVDGAVLVNELAMRPHNSGHWTIDGAVTSQFENHLRAVLDLPLGDPRSRAPYTVMVNILGGDLPDLYDAYKHVLAHDPALKVHLYGKEVKTGRKVGHVSACGDDPDALLARARHAADYFAGRVNE